MSILMQKPTDTFPRFLSLCSDIGVDAEFVRVNALAEIKYLRGKADMPGPLLEIERRWCDSLTRGRPDFEIYDTVEYVAEAWACWVVYSRRYLLSLKKWMENGGKITVDRVRGVVDLGCGIGCTTAALKELFHEACVVGTNLEGIQTEVARRSGLDVVDQVREVDFPVGLVFASEYFEHHERPIRHLVEILRVLDPDFLLIANTFGSMAAGHFYYYIDSTDKLTGMAISRRFNERLRQHGYVKIETGWWNNRPSFWGRKGIVNDGKK